MIPIEAYRTRAIFGAMLDNFSERARQIVFAARFKAGERGAKMIDTHHFLVGLILEDQGMLEKNVFSMIFEGQGTPVNRVPSHTPFFSPKVAQDLLANLEKELPQLEPVPLTTEVPVSPPLEQVFNSAKDVQTRFRHNQTEPLHFLAAILTRESGQGFKLLQGSGITHQRVLLALRGTTES
jgi:ATP-dependent Clp protease ATP-binding subunit ClpA